MEKKNFVICISNTVVSARARTHTHTHTHTYIYIYMYIYIYIYTACCNILTFKEFAFCPWKLLTDNWHELLTMFKKSLLCSHYLSSRLGNHGEARPHHCWGFEVILRSTRLSRTHLDEWSVRRQDLYLYLRTRNAQNQERFMPPRDSKPQSTPFKL